jgi:hypothetical protein
MKSVRKVGQPPNRWIEGAATGVGYSSALVVLGVFAMGSFRPAELPTPYWGRIDWLRTDTFGVVCFIVAVVSLIFGEFLRLSRRVRHRESTSGVVPHTGTVFLVATCRALVAAGSMLIAYLSINAITHPQTLTLPATHLLSWPTEGTLRVMALVATACAAAFARAQRITMSER